MTTLFLLENGTSLSFFFFSSRRRHTRFSRDWSSDVCSSDLVLVPHGPPRTIRVALTDFRWPLDPALATTRDETTLARALYATPLRTDAAGRVVPGLCSAWNATPDFRTWRFTCRAAPAIAAALRRVARMDGSPSQLLF